MNNIIDIDIDKIDGGGKGVEDITGFGVVRKEYLDDLESKIKSSGKIDPIKVFRKSDGRYGILDGHHRYFIALKSDLKKIPCIVLDKETNNKEIPGVEYDVTAYTSEIEINIKPDSYLVAETVGELGERKGIVLMKKYDSIIDGKKVKNYKMKIKYGVRYVFSTS